MSKPNNKKGKKRFKKSGEEVDYKKLYEEEKRQKEEEKRQKEKAQSKLVNIERKSVVVLLDGFPIQQKKSAIDNRAKSTSTRGGVLARGEQKEFGIFEHISQKDWMTECYSGVLDVAGKAAANNEATNVSLWILPALQDILKVLQIGEQVELVLEVPFLYLRPDIFLVVSPDGIPCGIVEAKRSTGEDNDVVLLNKDKVLGQAYDYLMLLRSFGVKHPFVILTTYNVWKVVWLPESDNIAQEPPNSAFNLVDAAPQAPVTPTTTSTTTNTAHQTSPTGSEERVHWSESTAKESTFCGCKKSTDTDIIGANDSDTDNVNVVHMSKSYKVSQKDETVRFVASAVAKMIEHRSQVRVDVREPGFAPLVLLELTAESYSWMSAPKNAVKLDWSALRNNVDPSGKTFYAMCALGRGANAICYLVYVPIEGGKKCVVRVLKYYNGNDVTEERRNLLAKSECESWTRAYSEKFRVDVVTVNNVNCLLMPYFARAPRAQHVKNEVRRLLEEFGQKSICYEDMHWHHVGAYENDTGKVEYVLIDLGDVKVDLESSQFPDNWLQSALDKLKLQ